MCGGNIALLGNVGFEIVQLYLALHAGAVGLPRTEANGLLPLIFPIQVVVLPLVRVTEKSGEHGNPVQIDADLRGREIGEGG